MNLDRVDSGRDIPNDFNVIIEAAQEILDGIARYERTSEKPLF